jgi:hypothetical protein
MANSNFRKATTADRARNYPDAMQWWLRVVREGSGVPIHNPYVSEKEKHDEELSNQAFAAYKIGYYYQTGLGVKQDYSTAASWYQTSVNMGPSLPSSRAREYLGILYAHGLGVPQDRGKARALFASLGPGIGTSLIELLDANELPTNGDDVQAAFTAFAPKKREAEATTPSLPPPSVGDMAPSLGQKPLRGNAAQAEDDLTLKVIPASGGTFTYIPSSITITSHKDGIIMTNIVLNRGKSCKSALDLGNYRTGPEKPLSYPIRLNFADTFRFDFECDKPLLEISIVTNRGTMTFSSSP